MIFRDLAFANDCRQERKEGKLSVFNKGYYLAQLYLYFLGKKFVLDGCGKLTIYVKHRTDEPKYLYSDFFGVSHYYLDDDQVDTYFSIENKEEAGILLCDYTHDALIDIATRSNCSEETINKIHYARDAIIKNNFSLSYEMTKYSKTDRSRRYRALVFRNINCYIDETWSVRIIDKKDNDRVVYDEYLSDSHLYCNGIYRYEKTMWEGNLFIFVGKSVNGRSGVIWDKIDINQ